MKRMRAVYGLSVGSCMVALWACRSPSDFNAVSQSPADGGQSGKDSSSPSGDDDDGGSPGTGFCAQHKALLFCDDFDGKALGDVWDGVEPGTNGSVTTDQVDWSSSPNSLLTKTSAITASE